MPTAIASALVPILSNLFIAVGLPTLAFGATIGLVATGAAYLLLAGGAYLLSSLFSPSQQQNSRPEAPKPEDGKYNLKQSVPPLVYVLGKVKKAGDYAFLEETGGTAFHITVWAAHHIKGYVSHWLHDEQVTLDGLGRVSYPGHFSLQVYIDSRRGDDASTVYPGVKAAFPAIWNDNHRGDGLATVATSAASVASEYLQAVYPSGMPQHQAIGEGHDRLIDPRTGMPGYSTNFAVFRYWHLTHPVGGKLTVDDLYTPDWANAADVCDENVFNRTGGTEKRYHGGLWFRATDDPVAIGRTMDQAGELVIYERADGTIGVHAGEFVEPDIRLTANDLVSVSYDPNKRRSTNVLAVRGRYTDPAKGYNTTDAAIYGIPYPSDDERTKTVENPAVQSHNHIARMQKLAWLRANAPRVNLVAHYEPAKNIPYRRFIKVHYPPKMTEVVVEIVGRPTLSLRNLTYSFEGIVLTGDPYAFIAALEEGAPGASVTPVARQDVPVPTGFDLDIEVEAIGGGSNAAYGLATFDVANDTFTYEMEWQATAGGAVFSDTSVPGGDEIRTGYLADGTEYRFRLRAWSAGASSEWTGYEIRTASADPTPPGVPTLLAHTIDGSDVILTWRTPNSANFYASRLWRGTSTFGTATEISGELYSAPNSDQTLTDTPAAGTWLYWVTAENASGVASAPAGPESATV